MFKKFAEEALFIGEVGLDGSKEFRAHLGKQIVILHQIFQLCEESSGKIISLHSRGATRELLNVIQEYPYSGNIVLHWFTGSLVEAQKAVSLGCFFSINYAMLQSDRGRKLIASLPINRILTESDGPFIEFNGQPFSSVNISIVLKMLADLWRLPINQTEYIVDQNYKLLLDI